MDSHHLKKLFSSIVKHWRYILIWTLGVIVLVGLTLKDALPLIYAYKYKNSLTQVEIIPKSDLVKQPSLAFCIPHRALALKKFTEFLLKNGTIECRECERLSNELTYYLEDAKSVLKGDIENDKWIVGRHLLYSLIDNHTENNFNILSLENFYWNQPLIDAVWNLLVCISQYDIPTVYKQNNCTWGLNQIDIDFVLTQKSVINKLFERMINILCAHIDFPNCFDTFLHGSTRFDQKQFCFNLSVSGGDQKVIINSQSQYGTWDTLTDMKLAFYVFSDTSMITYPHPNFEKSDALFRSDIEENTLVYENLHLIYLVQSTVAGSLGETCNTENTFAECIGNCVVKMIFTQYRCIPFTFRKNPVIASYSHFPYCNSSFTNIDNCTLSWKEERDYCNNYCDNLCNYVFYQWRQILSIDRNKSARQFTLTIRSISSPYIQFTDIIRDSWEKLVSNVGGIMNLYLGISGLTAIAILIQLVDFLRDKKQKRNINIDSINPDLIKYLEIMEERLTKRFETHLTEKLDKTICNLETGI